MSLFGDLFEIAITPVRVVTTVAEAVTKPVADAAKEIVKDLKEELE